MNPVLHILGRFFQVQAEQGGPGNKWIDEGSFWLPGEYSTLAGGTDWVFNFIMWISIVFFVFIVALMLFFMIRYHANGQKDAAEGPTHNTPLEIFWTIVPLVIVLFIFYYGFRGYIDMRTPPAKAYEVQVTGRKWSWQFTYPGGVTSADLHVPVNKPVRLVMTSTDVIHSFYVPAFRIKMDVVPGRYTTTWFEATDAGSFKLQCAEYCGTLHSGMLADVVVHTADEFNAWIEQQAAPAEGLSPVALGEKLFKQKGCNACHNLTGEPGVGPSWEGIFGKAHTLASGATVEVDENYLRESIVDPQAKIVAGYPPVMPTYQGQLSDQEIGAIIALIKDVSGVKVEEAKALSPEEEAAAAEQALVQKGEKLFTQQGCNACHSTTGQQMIGPSWKGAWGETRELESGETVSVDADYIRESIAQPQAKIVKGFPPVMPPYPQLSDEDLKALVAYIKSLD